MTDQLSLEMQVSHPSGAFALVSEHCALRMRGTSITKSPARMNWWAIWYGIIQASSLGLASEIQILRRMMTVAAQFRDEVASWLITTKTGNLNEAAGSVVLRRTWSGKKLARGWTAIICDRSKSRVLGI